MKKQWATVLLALILAAVFLPATAWAAETDRSAGSRLTGVDRAVYDILKTEVIKIADGARADTKIKVPDQPALSWTLAELGIQGGGNVLDKVSAKFSQSLHLTQIYECLSADLPYEMYWKSNSITWGYTFAHDGSRGRVQNLVVHLEVAEAYRGGSSTKVSPAKAAAAKEAAEQARAIAAKYADKSDYEKLAAYRDEICRLVSYNQAALDEDAPYGDPWQLVYVFDGDPSTNVVCEGYAKAFKYLCDLSDFQGNVTCYTVTGLYTNGQRHMWNVVQMDNGQRYLVDVTNCDSGMVGADGSLFLSGASGSEDGRTWTISKPNCYASYTYNETEQDMFTDGYLALGGSDYAQEPAFTDVPPEHYCAQAVDWALGREITKGTSPITFSPDQICSHGEILTFLWRAAGKPESSCQPSSGVQEDRYCYAAAKWAAEQGMIDDSADLGAACTRADAVTYIWLAFGRPDAPDAVSFDDVPGDSPYAGAVSWAAERGVTTGTSSTAFQPELACSRGQIVTFLHRAYHQTT